jgi:hypothetical protein
MILIGIWKEPGLGVCIARIKGYAFHILKKSGDKLNSY